MSKRKTTQEFITQAKKVHNDKYDYSLVDYINNKVKVKIICPIHGIFEQTPNNHLNGCDCVYCKGTLKKTTQQFITQAKKVHNNKYDYSLVTYSTIDVKVKIICSEHGVFEQSPKHHLNGSGCPICTSNKNGLLSRLTTEEFIRRAKIKHKLKFNYSKTKYTISNNKVKIICNKHEVMFEQRPYDHIHGLGGCPQCATAIYISKPENQIAKYITKKLKTKVITSDRTLIEPLELDIIIPEHKIAIEFNGLYWHSENNGKDRHYHKNKTDLCKKEGYRLIHIFEDDWLYNKKKIKKYIKHLLGKSTKEKIYARKTVVKCI